ncbi:TPA: hypothetical protein N0F65_012671 [Lagenidium giganteum]|uniref:Peptidyl-prolyl cis-trans isomerase n=1 Tax=Lagenidium giganteum TaxID=4803 RepID=A0AAV2YMZ5_9STRA|nr:TPA: hypothetical protein N0F65_012671 [Lagenidium giganteum]
MAIKSIDDFTVGSEHGPPLVYMDLGIGDRPLRRLRIELLHHELPYTCENFRMLTTGERKGNSRVAKTLCYKNSRIHRVVPGFMMQGGDITHGNGVGGSSAYGRVFEDESFLYKHQVGSVSMAHQNSSNKSQFVICFGPASWLDGKHVVFGQVLVDDLPHLAEVESVGSSSGRPVQPIVINDCGQLAGDGLLAHHLTSSAIKGEKLARRAAGSGGAKPGHRLF